MSEKNMTNLSPDGSANMLNDGLFSDDNSDILYSYNFQENVDFSFPGNNGENNMINSGNGNYKNKDKIKVKVKNLDDLINIRTNLLRGILKKDKNKETIDWANTEIMDKCDQFKIGLDGQTYILYGFINKFDFTNALTVWAENQATEDFIKLCVILWRFICINKTSYANADNYRCSVVNILTYNDRERYEDNQRCTLRTFLFKIAQVPGINRAFEKMKQINVYDMKLRGAVKDDFKKFVDTLRECNLKIVIQNGCMKAVRDRTLSLKKLALVLGSAITGILTIIFIYNLIHVFIPISLGISILLFVVAFVSSIVFVIINVIKKIFHLPCIHTKACEKDCNLDFDLDCYDYPENEKPTIKMEDAMIQN